MKGKMFERWHHFCLVVLRLFYLNFLWGAFTFLGLFFFGIGPATVAMLAVIRQYIRGEENVKIFSLFWKEYKSNFKQASLLGLLYIFAGIVLATNIMTIQNFYFRLFFIFVSIFYFISLLYIGPVMVHFNIKGIGLKIKMSLVFGIGYLHYTLTLGVALAVVYFLILMNSGILMFFGVSIGAYVTMRFTHQVFKLVEISISLDEKSVDLEGLETTTG